MEKLLILIRFIILIYFFIFKDISSQTFDIPENFIEAPLIFSHETTLVGVSKIVPIGLDFSKYSKIELSKVNSDIIEPESWLKDKLYNELGGIAETDILLNSKDSPLSDPIFDQFKHLPMYIEDTMEQLAINPFVFCDNISKKYNKNGVFFELSCTVPFGFFNKYLSIRLQFENMLWYFTKVTSLNYTRFRELLNIAESFSIKK